MSISHISSNGDSNMALLPEGYELGHYQSLNFTRETLFRFNYGVACVSNVDGRGNVSIYSMIRRQGKRAKPIFDYANILGYVGGEMRDGFCNANLKEGEALRFMQTHIELSKGRAIRMVYVPVEEVSALFVLPLHKKSLERGMDFPDSSTASAFEYFKQVAKYCPYQTVEEFFEAKLARAPRKPDRTKFNTYRSELESWWLEKSELVYHDCPLPSQPPTINLSNLSSMMGAGPADFISGLMEQASNWSKNHEDSESWKKTAAKKFTSDLNYERFGGMAKQQALWYIWMGDLERAKVMVDAWKRLEEGKANGRALDQDNVVVEVVLDSTLGNLSSRGMCAGQSIVDARLTPKDHCDTCLSPVSSTKKCQGLNILTCVGKDANGEFGCKGVRENVAKLLFAVSKFGVNRDFELAAAHCFKEALHTFLEHSFTVLFWRIKPTNPMTAATENEALPRFIESLRTKEKLNVTEWANSCTTILGEALTKHCSQKLGKEDVKKLCVLFRSKMNKILVAFKKLAQEEASSEPSEALTETDVSMDLFRKTVAPSMAQQFKHKWQLFSIAKRRKVLTADAQCLIQACNETFQHIAAHSHDNEREADQEDRGKLHTSPSFDQDMLSRLSATPKEPEKMKHKVPEQCVDNSCACRDSHKLWQHMVGILSSENNPIPFYKCLVSGDVVLQEDLTQDQEGTFFDDMIDLNEEFVRGVILPIEDEVFSDSCPRLTLLCKIACHRLFPMLLENVIHKFGEIEKKDNIRFECQPCQGCGTLEKQPGDFKRCGACKSVFYCGRKCQAQDWKAGHKKKCKQQTVASKVLVRKEHTFTCTLSEYCLFLHKNKSSFSLGVMLFKAKVNCNLHVPCTSGSGIMVMLCLDNLTLGKNLGSH